MAPLNQRRLHASVPLTAIGYAPGWIWAKPDCDAPPFSIPQTVWEQLPELEPAPNTTLTVDTIQIDLVSDAITRDSGERISVTPAQFRLAVELAKARGAIVSRDNLFRNVLYRPWRYDDRSIDQLVVCLRSKLPRGRDGRSLVQSVRTQGYRMRGIAA